MSNKVSESLFRLIKSLTKAEKRYFKIYSSRHTIGEQNNYQMLFDAIDKQDEYDEDAIKKQFKKQAFIKKLSIAKGRLYDAILRSLDAFHANSSIDIQLKRNLHSVEILYKKSLYDQCNRVLRSAKKVALKYEKHTTLLEIFRWEKKLIEKDNYEGTTNEDLEKVLHENEAIQHKIEVYNEFWYVKSRLFNILNKRGKVRTEEELQSFKSIIDEFLVKADKKDLYFKTEYLYHHIYSAYYFGIGDYKSSYKYLKQNVAHIENHIELFKEEPNVYFSVLTNAIYIGSQLKKYDEVFKYLKKLRELPETLLLNRNEDLDIKLFSSAYSIELTVYHLTGDFEKGLELIPIVEEGLKLYGDKINSVRKAYFYLNIAVLYFGCEKYSDSLKWINRLLNDIDIDNSQDIHCFAQLLNLLTHLELGNERLVPYALKSTQRYLNTRNRVYKFETSFLNFISKVLKIDNKEDLKQAYIDLKVELEQLAEDNFEKSAFEYFDFLSWAESKATGKPFKEIVQEKALVV